MSTRPKEVIKKIRSRISVTQQKIIQAKAYVFDECDGSNIGTEHIINAVEKRVGVAITDKVDLSQQHIEDAVIAVAESISWRLAIGEAILDLIHEGVLCATNYETQHVYKTIKYKMSNFESGISSEELNINFCVPNSLCKRPSHSFTAIDILCSPDLFLHDANIPGLPKESEDALREAVCCFRHKLYTACLAMLGKASEGAWIECGLALIKAAPQGTQKMDKEQALLLDPHFGIGRKIESVLKLYERQDLFKTVLDASGMSLKDLRSVVIWSDQIRDSRNTVHYGAKAHLPNTYEIVAALLMGAVPHFKVVCTIKLAAEKIFQEKSVQTAP